MLIAFNCGLLALFLGSLRATYMDAMNVLNHENKGNEQNGGF
jgi:hypothetical protein